jgi:hypothetical protein
MGLAGHAAAQEKIRSLHKLWEGKFEGMKTLGRLEVAGQMILK